MALTSVNRSTAGADASNAVQGKQAQKPLLRRRHADWEVPHFKCSFDIMSHRFCGSADSFVMKPMRPTPNFSRRTLQHNIYEHLRESLMSGQLAPGERLTVRGVAAQMGTSVMPVREAFRRLTSEGALEFLSTGFTQVPVLDVSKLQELTEIRLVVEGLAAHRAALRVTKQELDAIEAANAEVSRASRAGDVAAVAQGNEVFHFLIYRASQSAELVRIIERLWLKVGPCLTWLLMQQPGNKGPYGVGSFKHHKELISALRRHEPDKAAAALKADIATAAAVVAELSTKTSSRK
jgi:DNA-binding GntR family transcriptional regulator